MLLLRVDRTTLKAYTPECCSSGEKPKASTHCCGAASGSTTLRGFFGDLTLEKRDDRRDYGEIRMQAIGRVDDDILFVVYTDRGDVRHIISARRANKKERTQWHLFAERWRNPADETQNRSRQDRLDNGGRHPPSHDRGWPRPRGGRCGIYASDSAASTAQTTRYDAGTVCPRFTHSAANAAKLGAGPRPARSGRALAADHCRSQSQGGIQGTGRMIRLWRARCSAARDHQQCPSKSKSGYVNITLALTWKMIGSATSQGGIA